MVTIEEINRKVATLPDQALEELGNYIDFLAYKHIDWATELTEVQKATIGRGLEDINNNRILSHSQVQKKMRYYLNSKQ